MVETIKAKWSENTGNRKAINEDVIAQGIKENSLVNSDELNAVVHRQDTMLDDLQRGNAWNIGKTYNIGDMIFLNVNYKRLSDAEGKKFKVYLYSLRDDNTQEPFKNNNGKAISFAKNYDYAVTQFIIQVDNDNTPLSHFVNTDYWHIVDATANDLSNATMLNVSNETKLGTLGSDSSIITFNKDLNINNDIITHADFNIKGDLKANRMTTNNNIAFNNAFCATPLRDARNNEIINAEWANNHLNGRVFELTPDSNINTLPSPLYFYADNRVYPGTMNCLAMNKIPLDTQLSDYPNLFNGQSYPLNDERLNISLLQYALVFPQDFNMQDYNYISFNIQSFFYHSGSIINSQESWWTDCYVNFDIFDMSYYTFCIFNILTYIHNTHYNTIYDINPEVPKVQKQGKNFLSVDFSNSFEVSVYKLLGENIGLRYAVNSYKIYFVLKNNFLSNCRTTNNTKIADCIIKWEKDKRRLSLSFKTYTLNERYYKNKYGNNANYSIPITHTFKLYLK